MCYALDESLSASDPATKVALETAMKGPGLAALVLKPSLLGGFAPCLSLYQRAPPGTEVAPPLCIRIHVSVGYAAVSFP
jgi:hypothetical protein